MSRSRILGCLLAALATEALPAEAQLGGLIKKKAGQAAAAVQSAGQQVTFDNEVLELTPARIARLVAGKNAGKKLATGPNAPAALRNRLAQVEDQYAKLSDQNIVAFQTWDEQRRTAGNCRDSVFIAIKDGKQLIANQAFTQKAAQLGMAYVQAQARNDSAGMRRLAREMENLNQPTAADSALAVKTCPVPVPSPVVKQLLGLQSQVDSLNAEIARAEDGIRTSEDAASGMTDRQRALACERVVLYLAALKSNQKQTGFTQTELDAIAKALKDLEAACT